MATLLYQGHGSFRITANSGQVIYVDPYAGEGYDKPADVILVSHEHGDHNQTGLVAQKDNCVTLRAEDVLVDGAYRTCAIGGLEVQAVPACNKNHDRNRCVGFILRLDGISLYGAGDTSTTDYMAEMKAMGLDYALLPADGIYNMDLEEAAACAKAIGAKHTIPIHIKPGELYDLERAKRFDCPGRLLVQPGEEITL